MAHAKTLKQERLAQALRDNLKKRKAQERARSDFLLLSDEKMSDSKSDDNV